MLNFTVFKCVARQSDWNWLQKDHESQIPCFCLYVESSRHEEIDPSVFNCLSSLKTLQKQRSKLHNLQVPLKPCHTYLESDQLKKKRKERMTRYKSNLTQLCVSKTLLTPSCGCLSLHHAADNELVLPTHCISPHHLHCSPGLLPSGLRFLHGASGGEERLGGLRGRRRGYGSFRREINNKPPAARPQQWSQCELFSG